MQIKKSLYASILLGLSMFSQAKIFEASGVGNTPELAKKDAVANAIKFSVGETIVSKEELNNEQFTQRIVGYSDGYVKNIEIISNIRLPNGGYEASVKVDIESQKLIGTLKEMNVAVLENAIDNTSLMEAIAHFEKKEANEKSKDDYKSLAEELLLKPIQEGKKIIDIEIVEKLKPLKPEENSDLFPFEFSASVGVNQSYIEGLKKLLDINQSKNSAEVRELSDMNSKKQLNIFYISDEKRSILSRVLYKVKNLLTEGVRVESDKRILVSLINKDGSKTQLYDRKVYNDSYYEIGAYDSILLLYLPHITSMGGQYYFYSKKNNVKIKLYLTKADLLNLKDIELTY
ncbi:hypothetical protein E4T80_00695 [Muribacter muris]|uniref:Uncharacterized protein n=1 Tax=Muribacter muris TaxID=67855 RepID=A0A4Y9K9T4_9PAST|nr:hypothetical protein [Muribacter muris]MBF0784001.1 hypothetical protein [Muribacter muris]MBF0827450.1 hypothetical protein [Muribacter muris]TFV13395.1 hypothetical protein E4T80_00695 [Muribacter muris]